MPKRTKRRSAGSDPPPSAVPEDPEPSQDDEGGQARADEAGASEVVGAATRELAPTAEHEGALVPRDALSAYMSEIRRYPVLTREEEHELALKYYEDGDEEAAYKLITSNLRLVVVVAREYQRAFHNLLDLIQEGNIGLLEAVKKFDPYKGVRLPSYAVWWIRAYVIRYVMNNFRLVKVGTTQAQRRLFFNLQKEKARLESKGFSPDAKTIASNLGVTEKEVIEMDQRMSSSSEVSTEQPVGSEGETRMLDLIPNQSDTAEEEFAESEFYGLMRDKLESFRDTLEGRDLEIFNERMLAEEPLTLVELGGRYGVSRERVRQLEERVRSRLRDFLVDEVHDLDPAMFDD
ncbi:MAG: RNA polymerase factor sigma-32 [Deltaproteobacteria bacterium]